MDEHIRGGHHVQRVGSSRLLVEPPVRFVGTFVMRADTHVGAVTEFGRGCEVQAARIGRYCEIGPGCLLGATGHPTRWLSVSAFQYKHATYGWHPAASDVTPIDPEADGRESFRSVPGGGDLAVIGNDVFLGANVVVLRGVTIGDGCVVAAGSVVTRDLPPYTIAGGSPARPIRGRVDDALRDELLDLRWWRFSPNQLDGVPFADPSAAAAEIRRRVESGLEPYEPGFVEIPKPAAPAPVHGGRREALRRLLRG